MLNSDLHGDDAAAAVPQDPMTQQLFPGMMPMGMLGPDQMQVSWSQE
jgi:hypothetical protein